MKVRIVCYEDVHSWIIGKFALKMEEHLLELGHEVSIAKTADDEADINHHLIYRGYSMESTGIQTLMITHVDSTKKINLVKKQLTVADMGICMSAETVNMLANLGVPREKLSYVNPAHDGIIKPRKLVLGLTCRVQKDGRKREFFLNDLAKLIDPQIFSFKIMGDGWDEQIEVLRSYGFDVEWDESFNYDKYVKLIPSLDYYIYMGMDEGQMGFVDAVAAGIKTIVTTQGYHLDAKNGITHGFSNYEELKSILLKINNDKLAQMEGVASWNWLDYTKKHIDIWEYLIAKKQNSTFKYIEKSYADGVSSINEFTKNVVDFNKIKAIKDYSKLFIGKLKHSYYGSKNKRKKKF